MSAPYYFDEQVTLHLGDALEVARTLPDQSADCIVTSPPYFGLRDYGTEGQYGLEASPQEYVETMRVLFAELRRVLADDGTLWLNIGDSYYSGKGSPTQPDAKNEARRPPQRVLDMPGQAWAAPKNLLGIPWRVAFALQDDGWILRNAIIWAKANSMPESVTDRFSGKYEHVFLLSKCKSYWFDLDAVREPHAEVSLKRAAPHRAEFSKAYREGKPYISGGQTLNREQINHANGKNPGDVWTLPTQPFAGAHFAVFPVALPQRCILAGCPPKRCQECGHAPEKIVEKGEPPPQKNRRGRSVDLTAESFQRSNLSGQEWNAWKAENPDKVTGYTDCGHNAYRAGVVLDPFNGSGTTGLAAQRLGRKYIGIDLNREYLDLSLRTRLNQSALDFGESA